MIVKHDRMTAIEDKIVTKDELGRKLYLWNMQGHKIVFTNGCFDILHRGHAEYLAKAANEGNVLIVGINSDASVKRLGKNSSRPLQDENSRAFLIASLDMVEAVIIFDEDTPLELIKFIQPQVLIKGADYDANEKDPKNKKFIVGSDVVTSRGGIVKTVEFLEGYSTSAIEEKIRSGK